MRGVKNILVYVVTKTVQVNWIHVCLPLSLHVLTFYNILTDNHYLLS